MYKAKIKINSKKEQIAVLKLLVGFGGWIRSGETPESYAEFPEYNHVVVDRDMRMDLTSSNWDAGVLFNYPADAAKLIEFLSFPLIEEKIRISDEWVAHVTKDGIKVGCQSISFERFDELAKVVKEVRVQKQY